MHASAKPKLLCIVQLPPPVHGASLVNASVVSSEQLASAVDVEVLPLEFADSIADIGRPSARKLARTLSTTARLAWRLLRDRPDAAYFTISPVGGAFYRDCVFVAVLKTFRVPRIYHLHGKGISQRLDKRWRRGLYAWAFRGAAVIHLSPTIAESRELVPADQIDFVPNGVEDVARAAIARASRERPKVLFLSNIVAEKGVLVLAQALDALAARGVAFEATFAGSPGNAACVRALEELCARHPGQIRYVGPVFGAQKLALLRDHDVFAFPTYYAQEAFPLVVLEAMQFGLPVVATPEGAIPDMVGDGDNGYLVAQHDVDALARRLEELLVDADLRARFSRRSRERYEQSYTFEHFERGITEVLARRAAPRRP
ncbi:MAG TPA: glycosyltransferase family 4 protein [Kofleriaceae bacterium]|nr:glycosyltransferase family 4 protein [Kofleriaceae bacterium]